MKKDISSAYKIPLFSALAAVLIAVPLRVYQYFNIIEPETGFYNKTDFSVFIIYAVLAIAMIIGIVFPFLNHNQMTPIHKVKKTSGFLIVSVLMAIGVIADSAMQLISYFDLFSVDLSTGSQTINQYVSSQGGTFLLIQAILGGFTAVYFFVSGLTVGIGNSDGSKFKVLALSPVVWCIFRLLYRFKRTISFINVSDLMLELFMIVFAMMFFLAYAQVTSKIDSKAVFWKIYAYGIPAAMFSLVCFLPRFIATLVGKGDLLSEHYGVHYSDLAFAVFIVFNLITRATSLTTNKTE